MDIINTQNIDKQQLVKIKQEEQDILEDTSFFQITSVSDFKCLIKSCVENSLSLFLEYFPNIITLYFINNSTTQIEASGFGLGLVWQNCIAQGIYFGLSGGFETLAAHAHGAGNYQQVGLLFQRTLYITLLLFIPISIIMINTENILLLWNSDKELCRHAAQYCIYALPGLFISAISFPFQGFLNAQNIYSLQYKAVALSVPFHYFVSFLFISVFDLKVVGGAIAFTCTSFSSLSILYFMVNREKKYKKCFIPFNKQCMNEIIPFLKIVIPIGSLLTLEWLVYETYSILASNLISAQYSAHIVLANFNTIYYQFPEGYSIASSSFIGNEMGSNKPNKAKRFAKYGIIIALFHVMISLFPIYIFKYEIIRMFSVDNEVYEQLASNFNIFLIVIMIDCSQTMLSGFMRAIGKERYSSISFIICYVGVGIFSSYLLAFPLGFELKGIWYGAITGMTLYDLLQIHQLAITDWNQQALLVQERVEEHNDIELDEIKDQLP